MHYTYYISLSLLDSNISDLQKNGIIWWDLLVLIVILAVSSQTAEVKDTRERGSEGIL